MADTTTQTFSVSGMHCASCGLLIDEELSELAGVVSSSTDSDGGHTVVTYDPQAVGPDAIVAAISAAGYTATPTPG